jgi:hypothetical protein
MHAKNYKCVLNMVAYRKAQVFHLGYTNATHFEDLG